MMTQWKASIAYDAQNTMRLTKTLFNVFHIKQRLLQFLLSAIIVTAGFLIGIDQPGGLLSLSAGCVLMMNTDMGARRRARVLTQQLNGYVPKMDYTFGEESFRGVTDKEDHSFRYEDLIRISDDGKYWYLFPDQKSGFMIDPATLQPENRAAFKEHIAARAGIQWTSAGRLLSMGLLTFFHDRKNTRKPPKEADKSS